MTWEQQEKLTQYKDIILTDPIPTKKQRMIDFLEAIDFTTKKGAKNWDKGFEKFEEYSQKFDKALGQIDESLSKLGDDSKKKPSKKKKKTRTSDGLDFELWES